MIATSSVYIYICVVQIIIKFSSVQFKSVMIEYVVKNSIIYVLCDL